jgi:hypothetical protein
MSAMGHKRTTLDHRYCLPVRLSCGGCSFQLGRTSTRLPPHLLHTARRPNDGTSVSAGSLDTSISAVCRHASSPNRFTCDGDHSDPLTFDGKVFGFFDGGARCRSTYQFCLGGTKPCG